MKHTALPWKWQKADNGPGTYHALMNNDDEIVLCWVHAQNPELLLMKIEQELDEDICFMEMGEEDGQFIVKACNCHEELVDLCQYIDYAVGGDEGEVYVNDEILEIHVTGKFVKDLKQALAKATK